MTHQTSPRLRFIAITLLALVLAALGQIDPNRVQRARRQSKRNEAEALEVQYQFGLN